MPPQRASSTGPAAQSFGRVLRQRRQELRLTLEQVAELAPCSVQHLSEIERGVRYGSLALLVRIDWALSGVGSLAGWVSALIVEQLSLHQPVFSTSRGREPLDPATNTRGEQRDAAAIAARADEVLAHLRRSVALTPDELSPAALEAPGPGLSPTSAPVHHGEDEPSDAALLEHVLPGGGGEVLPCAPLRLWRDGRQVLVRLLVADVDVDEPAAAGAPPRRRLGRRTFITVGTAGGLGTLGAIAGPPSGLVHISSANPRLLDYLEREAERLPFDFWSGSVAHFPRVEDAYELANSLIGELPRLRDQVRLHRVTAQLAVLRALIEVFQNHLDQAERWYRLAVERAVEVGDARLAVWALAPLASLRARTGGAPQQVIDIAAEARHLGGGQPCAAAAWLAASEAVAHARLGDRAGLLQKLSLAEAELARAAPSERVPSVFGYTDAQRTLHAAAAWVLAGEPQEAEREARQAITLYAPWHRTDLAVVRLHLAAALADQGGPDEACAVASEALPRSGHPDDRKRLRSSQFVHAVSEFDQHLERYQEMRPVHEFRELVRSATVGA